MKYKNTKTGVVIDSPCFISGGDWVEVKKETQQEQTEKPEKTNETEIEPEEETIEDLDGITKKEIMQELDAMGVKYDTKARKEVLYNLMLGK